MFFAHNSDIIIIDLTLSCELLNRNFRKEARYATSAVTFVFLAGIELTRIL